MNDVKKGIFEIDGIEVNREVQTKDIMTEKMSSCGEGTDYTYISSYANPLNFIGGKFSVEYVFYKDRLWQIDLEPFVGEDPGYPDLEYQKEKWDYCCDLLRKAFGKPDTEEDRGISFSFDGGAIGCYQILEGRMEGEGGNIKIAYYIEGYNA